MHYYCVVLNAVIAVCTCMYNIIIYLKHCPPTKTSLRLRSHFLQTVFNHMLTECVVKSRQDFIGTMERQQK